MLTISRFLLCGSTLSRKQGLATFFHERVNWALVDQSQITSETEWLCVDIDEYKIVNVHKTPPNRLKMSDIPVLPHSCLYASDFNCSHTD